MSAEPLEILMKKIRDLILENGHWAPIDEIEELVKTYGEQCYKEGLAFYTQNWGKFQTGTSQTEEHPR